MMVSSIVELTWARLFSEFVLKKNRGGLRKLAGLRLIWPILGSWNIFFPSSSHDGLEFGMGVFHLLYKNIRGGYVVGDGSRGRMESGMKFGK